MRITLDYGRTGLEVNLPDDRLVGPLAIRPAAPLPDPERAIAEALTKPIGSKPLAEVARGRRNACVLVCDITRPVPNRLILPPLLRTLEEQGIARKDILILIATGLHRPNEGAELDEMLGPDVAANYRVENHHGKVLEEHDYLGTTPSGVPVHLDRRYVRADLKVTTGLLEPHLMAGCDFIVNVCLDGQRRVTWVGAGDMIRAWEAGVRFVEQVVKAPVPEPVEVVVTSCAGYPLDTTWYQAVKGLTGALPIVKQGGTIVMAASLSEGLGSPEFQQRIADSPYLRRLSTADGAVAALKCDRPVAAGRVRQPLHGSKAVAAFCEMDEWQLVMLAKVLAHCKVAVVSDGLPAEALRRCHVEPAASVEQAVAESLAEYGPGAKVAVIPKGPYVLPYVA